MKKTRFLYFLICSVSVVVVLLGIVLGTFLTRPQTGAHAAATNTGLSVSVLPLRPMYKMAMKMGNINEVNAAVAPLLPCLASAVAPRCYSPLQLRRAYGAQQLLNAGITGKGRIITIIDAFQSPTLRADLRAFDRLFGLNDPQLNIIAPFGLTPFNPKDPLHTGFAAEISLDVEWAHAMAPGATIDLVLANVKQETLLGQLTALQQATNFAVQHSIGSVVSQSFGAGEGCLTPAFLKAGHKIFQQAVVNKMTVLASAGDRGAAAVQCNAAGTPVALVQGTSYPASDPLVTAVGGTSLQAVQGVGTFKNETVWNGSLAGGGAGGGGFSKVFAVPAFQQKTLVGAVGRGVPDVSMVGDPATGVPVVTSSLMPGQTLIVPFGGTSVGSPVWAGIVALMDQSAGQRLGFLNSAIYRLNRSTLAGLAIRDVITGNNTFTVQIGNGQTAAIQGFNAKIGWDAASGVGTPNVANLNLLLPQFIRPNDGANL